MTIGVHLTGVDLFHSEDASGSIDSLDGNIFSSGSAYFKETDLSCHEEYLLDSRIISLEERISECLGDDKALFEAYRFTRHILR